MAVCNLISARVKSGRLDWLSVGWFGGEPLLATSVIYQVMDHAIASCNESGVQLTSHITTNAYKLTRHVHDQLISRGIKTYNISLDGDQSAHDITRRRADGAGTFEQIWKNLCDMQDTALEFKVMLRLHVTSTNGESLERLMQKIRGQFGGDQRYEVYLRGIANYRNDEQVIYPDEIKVRTAENAASQLLSDSEIRLEEAVDICYAAKPNSLVIRPDGRIVKCTVALENDTNIVGRIQKNGELMLDQAKFDFWTQGFIDNDLDLLGCPAVKLTEHSV